MRAGRPGFTNQPWAGHGSAPWVGRGPWGGPKVTSSLSDCHPVSVIGLVGAVIAASAFFKIQPVSAQSIEGPRGFFSDSLVS